MFKTLSIAAAAVVLAAAGSAAAADGSVRPAHTFPDGTKGVKLFTHGGAINPTVALSLNFTDNMDSPGWGVRLDNELVPAVQTPWTTGDFRFIFSLHGVGEGHAHLNPPGGEGMHGTGGGTGFEQVYGDHVVDVLLNFTRGDYSRWTDASFAGGHNPPGFEVAQDFHFDPLESGLIGLLSVDRDDAAGPLGLRFSVLVDGTPLSFTAAPEPATWTMMIFGFGAGGTLLRRRRRSLAAA